MLHHEVLTAPGAGAPKRSLLFLHGILGLGTNLRTLARRCLEGLPGWQGVLVDLRAHGESRHLTGPDTVEQAAADVAALSAHLSVPVRGVVGHSFGGKVALQLSVDLPGLEHVVTVDSSPGVRSDFRGSELTLSVLSLLDGLRGPWARRDDFVAEAVAGGQLASTAKWLAMNLEPTPEGFRFGLDLSRIHALLRSYGAVDLWPVLEQPVGPPVHLVVGDRSRVYDDVERARAQALASAPNARVTVDQLPAGHWVHVDDLDGLVRVVTSRLAA